MKKFNFGPKDLKDQLVHLQQAFIVDQLVIINELLIKHNLTEAWLSEQLLNNGWTHRQCLDLLNPESTGKITLNQLVHVYHVLGSYPDVVVVNRDRRAWQSLHG